jgi:hypothetical protein
MAVKSSDRKLEGVHTDQPAMQAFTSKEQPIAFHVRWAPLWSDSGGTGRIILVARYGGPTTSWLSRAGEKLRIAHRLDPSLI